MLSRIRTLSAQRNQLRCRIRWRQQELRVRGHGLLYQARCYAGTPRSLVHAFLAGFLLDQARPMVPRGPSPLKLLLPWLMRNL